MSSRDRLLTILAAVSACGYLALAVAGDLKARPGVHLSIHALLFLLYLAAVAGAARERCSLPVALWAALAFRLILLPTTPTLSSDIHRYIWEGRLQLDKINPYRYAPADPELIPYRDPIYEGINHKELPAIYPPVTQWAFALGALAGRSTTAMKAIFVAADMVLVLLLAWLLRALRLPSVRILIYAWNPLVVVEVAGSGHNDSLALCFLVASTVGIIGQRRALSMTALALAALSKLFPIALMPLFAKRVKPGDLLLPPALFAACYLPYLPAGENLFRSAREYAERWRFNDSAFTLMVDAVEASGISAPAKLWADARGLPSLYTQPHMIARGLAALIALGVLAWLAWRQPPEPAALPRSIFVFTGTVLVLHPALHPWYLLWILPWLCVCPSPAWIALSGLAPLAYLEHDWVRWVEYPPFLLLLAFGWARKRLR